MAKIPFALRRQKPSGYNLALPIVIAMVSLVAPTTCFAVDKPAFRAGLWKFERTLETSGRPTDRRQISGLLIAKEVTRCTNPSTAMKAEFAPLSVAGCSTSRVRKEGERYSFQRACGEGVPVSTEIDVRSDSAYQEINEGKIGKIPTKETIVAQRVGDC